MTLPTRLAACFVLLAALTAACAGAPVEEVTTETVVPVVVEAAQTGSIRAVVHASGLVAPAPGADLTITAPEPARIAEMPKAEGDSVRTGDLLVRFDIPTLAADVASKTAEVSSAEARVENAKAAAARARDLFDRGVAARKEMEDADRDLAEANAALNQAGAAVGAARTLATRAAVRATFNGIVAKRFHNPGDLVEATATDPILRVLDPDRLEVNASVPIGDVSRITVGASAFLGGAPTPAAGALRVVSRPAAVEPGTAAVPVRLAFVMRTALPAGVPVQVDINAEEHLNVVVVPAQAVMREADETFVFLAVGDKAEKRAIVTGLADREHVEVRSGVKAGDLIIVQGQNGLPDGATISTGKAEKAADESPAPEK